MESSTRTQPSMASTKRPRRVDIISNSPEQILCHILSFLPTKTAVSCSILSKKWEFLWTSLPNLDFDDNIELGHGKDTAVSKTFVHFVYRVLLFRREWAIKKFRIKAECSSTGNEFHVQSWISAAVAHGVEELDINIRNCPWFRFPRSLLFSCKKLQVLKLDVTNFTVESCHFPSLKVLHLVGVFFYDPSHKSFHNLLPGCPVLEELILKNMQLGDDLRICVPTLRRLVVEMNSELKVGEFRVYIHRIKLVLETPALKYLSLQHHASEHSLVATNLCNLTRVEVDSRVHEIDIADKSFEPVMPKLLSTLSSVEFLNLSCNTMRVLAYSSSFNEFPVFSNLFRVELNIRSNDWVVLQHLLEKFHNLKQLVLIKELSCKPGEACWKEPLQVPNCLSLHLVTFCFQGFEGLKAETEFIKYLVKNSMVLKNVTISTSSSFKSRTHLLQELSMVPRGSKICQLRLT